MSVKTALVAPDISCNHCAMTIKRELGQIAEISDVGVDVTAKTIEITHDSAETLARAIALLTEIGYPIKE